MVGLVTWRWEPDLRGLEEASADRLWRVFATATPERRVVIVDIDEGTLARHGAWPWQQDKIGQLLGAIRAQGASLQMVDIILATPREGEGRLAAELVDRQAPVVLAELFSFGGELPVSAGRLAGGVKFDDCERVFPRATGYLAPHEGLGQPLAGHISPQIDVDGTVRRLPAMVCIGGLAYPALGLAGLNAAAGKPGHASVTEGGNWFGPVRALSFSGLPDIRLPIDADGTTRVSYRRSRDSFISVSAGDVLDGKVPPGMLAGAWVLVGATAFGIGDAVPTPHAALTGGVEVHAHFLTSLLDGDLPFSPRAALWLQVFAAFAGLALLLPLAAQRGARPMVLPAVALGLAVLLYAGHGVLLLTWNRWVGWLVPALVILVAGTCLAMFEYARARFERERLFQNLSSYLPASFARQIAFREPAGVIQAERCVVTVLSADIRNFSAYCEARPPEEAAALLHSFFVLAHRLVESHGGIVQEYVGDSLMAVWPDGGSDQAKRALACAKAMQAESADLFDFEPPEGLEPMALGIGIETGSALVGSFGPAGRRTYTSLGETITVAVRLQGMTTELAYPIIVGPGAANAMGLAADDLPLTPIGAFLLHGLTKSRILYVPVTADT